MRTNQAFDDDYQEYISWTKRCNVCGFARDRSYFTSRRLPNGKRWTLCKQCAGTQDMVKAAEARKDSNA